MAAYGQPGKLHEANGSTKRKACEASTWDAAQDDRSAGLPPRQGGGLPHHPRAFQ